MMYAGKPQFKIVNLLLFNPASRTHTHTHTHTNEDRDERAHVNGGFLGKCPHWVHMVIQYDHAHHHTKAE